MGHEDVLDDERLKRMAAELRDLRWPRCAQCGTPIKADRMCPECARRQQERAERWARRCGA